MSGAGAGKRAVRMAGHDSEEHRRASGMSCSEEPFLMSETAKSSWVLNRLRNRKTIARTYDVRLRIEPICQLLRMCVVRRSYFLRGFLL
mmetsp:Transcript_12848/g.47544  ORF Transcript_12848/g.47544 Transcript_12848/m.47544 type:complete len:89 (+) Transcript_12848:783-1049(+)|eukprot:scaffold1951_cov258-Pinguiococcus_pyrenoidosus.AAC.31